MKKERMYLFGLIAVGLSIITGELSAQVIEWARSIELVDNELAAGINIVNDVETNLNGNVYLAGQFARKHDFGGGIVTASEKVVPTLDCFVAKDSSEGVFLWLETMPAFLCGMEDVEVDDEDNIYLLANFENQITIGDTDVIAEAVVLCGVFWREFELDGTTLQSVPKEFDGNMYFLKINDSINPTFQVLKTQGFTIHPNPATYFIKVQIPYRGEELKLHLIDASERPVLREKIIGKLSTITLSELSSGTYLMLLENKSGIVAAEKLLINNQKLPVTDWLLFVNELT